MRYAIPKVRYQLRDDKRSWQLRNFATFEIFNALDDVTDESVVVAGELLSSNTTSANILTTQKERNALHVP